MQECQTQVPLAICGQLKDSDAALIAIVLTNQELAHNICYGPSSKTLGSPVLVEI